MTATLYALPYGKGLNMRKAKYTRHAHTGTDNGKTTKRNYRAVLLRGQTIHGCLPSFDICPPGEIFPAFPLLASFQIPLFPLRLSTTIRIVILVLNLAEVTESHIDMEKYGEATKS